MNEITERTTHVNEFRAGTGAALMLLELAATCLVVLLVVIIGSLMFILGIVVIVTDWPARHRNESWAVVGIFISICGGLLLVCMSYVIAHELPRLIKLL